jgi:hypothetical protein
MSATQFQSPIYQIFEVAFNRGDLAALDKLLVPGNHTYISIGGVPNSLQGLKGLIIMFRTVFPDLHCNVEDEIRVGDAKTCPEYGWNLLLSGQFNYAGVYIPLAEGLAIDNPSFAG